MNLLHVLIWLQSVHIVLHAAEHFFMPKLYQKRLLDWMGELDKHEVLLRDLLDKPVHYKF